MGARARRAGLVIALMVVGLPLATAKPAAALPTGFQVTTVISGLSTPTSMRFASDGRLFVAEKSGLIKVFDNLEDTTPTIFADLSTNVYNHMDRGLIGLELHPNFPATPWVYVVYTHDAEIGGTAPRWGTPGVLSDPCPDPPGAITDGCIASGRLSRLEAAGNVMVGPEHVMVEDWCSQFPSHSIGTVMFGPDGALYVGGGDGAKGNDWGQSGDPPNPCGDPPGGGALSPPTSEGGSLRSQDLRTMSDPVGLDGTIIRVDPMTGEGLPTNPMASSTDANARRVIAYGMRNPFRFAFRPGTNEIFIGDVGHQRYEEINVIPNATDATIENFGWPCYEGNPRNGPFDNRDFNLCEQLYAQPGAAAPTFFEYVHDAPAYTGDTCRSGGGVISAVGFYDGGTYPSQYNGALFFGDYARNCIWVMQRNQNGQIDRNTIQSFHTSAGFPVEFRTGPNGDLFYVDVIGRIRRISYFSVNQPPIASFTADPTHGPAPLTVNFDASASSDPEGQALTYSWDLDGDGAYGDATTAQTSYTYPTPGSVTVRVRVTDPEGASATASTVVSPGNTPPEATIVSPSPTFTWHVGESIAFSGSAADGEDGALPASAMSWSVILHHCPSTCHEHPVQDFVGQSAGSFPADDHEYPSHLELRLTVTDTQGLTDTESLLLYPETTTITLNSEPPGLLLGLNAETVQAPFTRTVVPGSSNAVTAPSPQTFQGSAYSFRSWSDAGARTHDVTATTSPSALTASYQLEANVSASMRDNGYDPSDLKIALGQNVVWTNTGTRNHTVTDNTGMGMFDSGAVAPGGTYARMWTASGRFPIRSTTDSNYRGSVWLPTVISPSTGTLQTGFLVTWASATQQAGYVSDIEIQRPASTSWTTWRTGQTATSAVFAPDSGLGTYSFRARLRNTANGRASAYSEAASIQVVAGNQAPSASIVADRTAGPAPLTVQFDGAGSTDPEGSALTYSWDLDGDGVLGDATTVAPSFTYSSVGDRTVTLRVTDPQGAHGLASLVISVGNSPPQATIDTPTASTTWQVGQTIAFSGTGTDPDDGSIPASAMTWDVLLHHCPSECHTHPVATFSGVASGSFTAPDHASPAHLELILTVTDTNGAGASASRIIQPQTTTITMATAPSGLLLDLNQETVATPFTRSVIVGSANTVNAPSPQTSGGLPHTFASWSDGGAQAHQITAPATPLTLTATYQANNVVDASMTDTGYSPGNLHLSLGQTARWTNTGTRSHTVTDNSGMLLFDSGAVAPGGTWSYTFTGAGRYPIRSTVDASYTGSVWVPMMVMPTAGSTATSFTVTWASANPPSGFVHDIQIQRPGSSSFVSWRLGQTGREAAFVPDAGAGTYSFRARIRSTSNGRASAYTETFPITVS